MTLNKHQSIRAGLCWIPEIAHLIRQHNNANVLVMPGRFIDEDMARKIMDEYFATEFDGGRHQHRIDKIPVSGRKSGEIHSNGDIYKDGRQVGEVRSNGDIYESGRNVGEVRSNGYIYKSGSQIGEVNNMFNNRWAAVVYFFGFFSF